MTPPAPASRSLVVRFPQIAAEIDGRRNGNIDLDTVSFGSSRRLWWRCAAGHAWKATVKSRTQGSGCPYCAGKRPTQEHCLASVSPELAGEWSTRNGTLTPVDVLPRSSKNAWWCCQSCQHHWQTRIATRARGSGCPQCARSGKRNVPLVAEHPHLASQWIIHRNGPLNEATVMAGSDLRAWWRCEDGHEWQARVSQRARGQGCPHCAHKLPTANSCLAFVDPAVASEWDAGRNKGLTPRDVLPRSGRIVWWRCTRNEQHIWQAEIRARTTKKTGCPFCSGLRTLPAQSLYGRASDELLHEWHIERNAEVDPSTVTYYSRLRVWWRCSEGHEWQARVVDRTHGGSSCPFCAHRHPTSETCLANVAPAIAAEWHPTDNGDLTPEEVLPASNRSVAWRCATGHEWRATVGQRTRWHTGCPECASSARKNISLEQARPDLILEWQVALNAGHAREVLAGSHAEAWWCCSRDSGHVWRARISNRTRGDTGCPYCAHKLPTPKTCLATVAPWSVDLWHPERNGSLSPTDLLPYSNLVVWWRCSAGHDWSAAPRRCVRHPRCPACAAPSRSPA